jgi:hypothetical protein
MSFTESRVGDVVFTKSFNPEAESKEKRGVWDPLRELTSTSPYVQSRVESTPPHITWATPCQSDFIPKSGTLDLATGGGGYRRTTVTLIQTLFLPEN